MRPRRLFLSGNNPTLAEIGLRVEILKTQHRTADLAAALTALLDRSTSFDVLEYVDQVAREQISGPGAAAFP